MVTFDEEIYSPEEYEESCNPLDVHPAAKGRGVYVSVKPKDNNQPLGLTAYTDGSKLEEKVGCAYAAMRQGFIIEKWKGRLRQNNSVFQSEALAILQAIHYVHSIRCRQATVKTDSLSTLHAIWNPDHPSEIIQEIQKALRNNPNFKITLEWIKAHAGHEGNEMADQLAKEATTETAIAETVIPWPRSYFKRTLRLKAMGKWQCEWDESNTGRRTHYFCGYVDTDRNIANTQLARFISGHGPFPDYFYKTWFLQYKSVRMWRTGLARALLGDMPAD
ncbi:uncharacterized protein LOC118183349 [Stegodyphus dumicola]|uniref:uncharacterized protein LOC118183349 n=1 Tax=Stegodyphus dumicola TaxID=202533 RepID=UPI0015A9407A|nr:uncharacterized protein LOC118183349 [Stegodyphus dumicola]